MSEMHLDGFNAEQSAVAKLQNTLGQRFMKSSLSPCPVEFTASFISLCNSQSCGKCTPCRIGLKQLHTLVNEVLEGRGTHKTLELIEHTATDIVASADCVIGAESAQMVLDAIHGFHDDFTAHIEKGYCEFKANDLIPCMTNCPAQVDIPGYIALVEAGRYTDAVKLIRKDNPLPVSCGMVCEHPCELNCRRGMLDNPVNIRGLKRYACDHAEAFYKQDVMPPTGKKVCVVGGGPAGLTVAFYLTIMGHSVTILEQRKHLGGMMRYGIPNYRFDKDTLEKEIQFILSTGVEAKTEFTVGVDCTFEDLRQQYDAVYLAIGAHDDKSLNLEGEDAPNITSAVKMLREIGDGIMPDYTGQTIVVVGGGNVAMDVARSSVRLGAKRVVVVYRRRKTDMPAQQSEIIGALEDGVEIFDLCNPVELKLENGMVTGVYIQPQIVGPMVNDRPSIHDAKDARALIKCNEVVVAIGQSIDSAHFEQSGVPVNRGKIVADDGGIVEGMPGVFSGGDCVSGPASLIKAIAAGKAASRNIDTYLGGDHTIELLVDLPPVEFKDRETCARSEILERGAETRRHDFRIFELGLSDEGAMQEASRCLHCDHFGYGIFRGGRTCEW